MSWSRHNDEREYDELVNWEARLNREGPFFRRLFDEHGVRTVADVGAGSARHAILFRSWGLDVTAIDPADDMLELAGENARRLGSDVRIEKGGFGEVAGILGAYRATGRIAYGPGAVSGDVGDAASRGAGDAAKRKQDAEISARKDRE